MTYKQGKPLTHPYTHQARRQTHLRTTYQHAHVVQKRTCALATSIHTRPEGHACPRMVGISAVDNFSMGGHANKALECPQGPGRRYLKWMSKTRKQQTKKKHNKPARKNAQQRKICKPKGTPPR